jgi:Mrp family chromosome partitioning ATPase
MGRILAALRKDETIGHRSAVPPVTPRPFRPDEPAAEMLPELPPEESEPYIEVGGRSLPIEASPDVLAQSPPSALGVVLPPSQTPEQMTGIAFCPLPTKPAVLPAPADRFARELIALHHPNDPLSLEYRSVLAGLTAQLPAARCQVVMCTGARPGVGTTAVALNLAIAATTQGRRQVAIVDAQLREPAVAERLGLAATPGLADVLTGTTSLQRALQDTGLPGLWALTAGNVDDLTSPRLASDTMRSVIRHLRQRCDLVIVDAPGWDGRPEIVALSSACDALFLILPQTEVEAPSVRNLLQVIMHQGAPLRGCIMTRGV